MKILMVTDDLIIGGVSRHVADLSNGLIAEGHSVTVAATDGPMRTSLHKGIRFLPLSLKDGRTFRSRPTGLPAAAVRMIMELRSDRYDLVHSHKRFSHLPAKLAALVTHTPHITTYHTLFPGRHSASLFGDRTICVSEQIERDLRLHHPARQGQFVTIHNGVHPVPRLEATERRELQERFQIPEGVTVIGSVGHFVPEKDRSTLLHAMRLLHDSGELHDTILLLHGFGPMEEELRQTTERLGLNGVVRFIGPDVPTASTIALSNMMVLSSITEGLPLVLLEAASAGIPHIATNVGGIPEVITDGRSGLLVPPQDPAALAESILRLIRDLPLRSACGSAIADSYRDRFGFTAMFEKTLSIYRSVSGGRV